MMAKRMHRAFFWTISIFMLAMLSACATHPTKTGRHGLFEDIGKGSGKSSIVMNEDVGMEEIHLTGKWRWPLESVEVSSSYGNRGHKFHQGVDLRAHMRTPVLAANDGVVVYVGTKIRGYGRMIVLKHEDNFYSIYAHHSKNLVKQGKKVSRGERIALSGKSGHASGPHLHFEIRQGTESYNPVIAINENIQRYSTDRKIASGSSP